MTRLIALVTLALALQNGAPTKMAEPPPDQWPMWGGTPDRNMYSSMQGIPTAWDLKTKKNIRWMAELGSQTYGNPR
jgi:hypothetical protein